MVDGDLDSALVLESLRSALKSQYHAGLAMLRDAIGQCPNSHWDATLHTNQFWQIAYHTLFFTHLYAQPDHASFSPWSGHQADSQNPDGIAGPPFANIMPNTVRFSPDGNTIAIGGDSLLLLWDRRARRLIGPPRRDQKDRIWSFAFSPDGKLLASAGSQSLRLWRLNHGWRSTRWPGYRADSSCCPYRTRSRRYR